MSEMRLEAINIINSMSDENLEKVLAFLKNLLQDDIEENIAELNRRIDDINHDRNIVTFTDEEWEKFINAQNIS
ncbi:MAG: hypothetical protein IKZ58_07570 [Selenomonadaceae bacterium]|nr:hypothetical protein [Selenomonadaceae bacterium]